MSIDRRPSGIDTAPVGTQSPALVRGLKIAVVGMGVMIIVGLAAVIWRIVDLSSSPKVSERADPTAAAASDSDRGAGATAAGAAPAMAGDVALSLPAGATVRDVTLSGNRMAVYYEAPSGAGIAVLDLVTGRTVYRVRLESAR